MKNFGTWARKWSFVLVFALTGTIYFTTTEEWKEYVKLPVLAEAGNAATVSGNAVVTETTIPTATAAPTVIPETPPLAEPQPTVEPISTMEPTPMASLIPTPTPQETYRNPEDVIYMTVEDDYFADALFIGDSRTVGLKEYGGMEEITTFYAATGLSVHKLWDSAIVEVPDSKEKLTVEEALQQNQFAKIYFMIGINEMGTGTVESFMEKYREAVAHMQELQPNAIIYLQAIMKVTTERSEQGDYIHNEGIDARNAEIAKLADNVKIFYLDVNPVICDETGGMMADYTFDGVHLKAQYTTIWKDFLKTRAVDEVLLD